MEVLPHGWQHSITKGEMWAVISNPLLRFGITTGFPDAETYMFVGRIGQEPWIEVAAEDEDGETWAVFHAMILTPRVSAMVFDVSGGAIDLRGECASQRPFIGPQYGRESQ